MFVWLLGCCCCGCLNVVFSFFSFSALLFMDVMIFSISNGDKEFLSFELLFACYGGCVRRMQRVEMERKKRGLSTPL